MTKEKRPNVCVLGGGLWGTVLADHLARKGNPVRLWEFFDELASNLEATRRHPHLPGMELSPSVRVTSDLASASEGAGLILFVLPSAHLRAAAAKLGAILARRGGAKPWIVNASKGIEPKTLKTMGDIIAEEIPALASRVFTLSGPSFARELSRDVPTALVLAGRPASAAKTLKSVFESERMRVDLSADRRGVELGGSLKNVLAVGCGMLDGMKAGANTKAAFITQGLAEMARLIRARGGKLETAYGLAGIGDLIATGTSPESRNRALGEKLGAGKSIQEAAREIPTVIEGVESSRSAHEMLGSSGASYPIFEAVWGVLHLGRRPRAVLDALGFRSHTANGAGDGESPARGQEVTSGERT